TGTWRGGGRRGATAAQRRRCAGDGKPEQCGLHVLLLLELAELRRPIGILRLVLRDLTFQQANLELVLLESLLLRLPVLQSTGDALPGRALPRAASSKQTDPKLELRVFNEGVQ